RRITSRMVGKVMELGLAKLYSPVKYMGDTPDPENAEDSSTFLPDMATSTAIELNLSRTGEAMGTACYMSPEQARGERLDARTDLFSLGVVLYEMATGHRAFPGNTATVIHDAILNRTPIPKLQLNPQLPAELGRITG